MALFWVEFSDRPAGTIEAREVHEATKIGEGFGKVTVANTLPYPAEPVLFRKELTCPPFCYTPNECKRRTSCPHSYSCSE